MSGISGYSAISFSIFNTHASVVFNNIKDYLSFSKEKNWIYSKGKINIHDIYFPEPLMGGNHLPKFSIWDLAYNKDTSVFMINLADNWYRRLKRYTGLFGGRCFQFYISIDPKVNFPAFIMNCFEDGENIRTVQLICEGDKWSFFQDGKAFPFENKNIYKKRKIRDRLTAELLIEYSSKIGCKVMSDQTWLNESEAYGGIKTSWD